MRTDLEKFDIGLAEAYNFYIDYRGGASNRAGTEFVDYLMTDTSPIRIFEFRFAPEVEDTYLLVFGDLYVRFVQSGAYILEAGVTFSDITQADPGVVTATGHGYSDGDWIVITTSSGTSLLDGRTMKVANSTANTFELNDVFDNNIDTTTYTNISSGEVARVYTVTTPYAAADLAELKVYQRRDQVTLTHTSYASRTLTRSAAASWTLATDSATSPLSVPTGVTLTPSSAGSAGMLVAVTAVDSTGAESLASRPVVEEASVNYTTTAGSLLITWTAVANAKYYNVYRSLVYPTGTQVTLADDLGFIGRAYGPSLVDNNIVPDFTKTPPVHGDPFADGAITEITITAPGTTYAKTDTVSVSGGGGSGFVGYPIIDSSGAILGVKIDHPGSGYSSPTVSFGTSTGSGATATATAGSTSGNFPGTSAIFEQRKVYGGTLNEPLTVFGTKPGDYDNHDRSVALDPTDAYEYEIESEEVAPIRHLLPLQTGLLVASKSGAWLFHGVDNGTVTALAAKSDPISFNGFSQVSPLRVDNDVVYTQEGGSVVRALVFNPFSRSSQPEDISTLANHLIEVYEIEKMTLADDPFKIIWAQREDGALLSLTYMRDQKVFAWAQHWTKGLVRDVQVVREGSDYYLYLVVERYINGRWTKLLERMAQRQFNTVEDPWFVDSGLRLAQTTPAATLTPAAYTGTSINFTASAAVFSAGDVGKVIRSPMGKARVTSFTSTTVVVADIERDFETQPEDDSNEPRVIASGDWTLDAEVTTVTGLWHLEGETVRVFADGNVQDDQTVSGGAITLATAASKVLVGLKYVARLRTLPLAIVGQNMEGRYKNVNGLAVRMHESRGLAYGTELDYLYEMKDRTDEVYGEPTRLQSKIKQVPVEDAWDPDAQVYFQQSYPLPATVLGYTLDVNIGDEKDARGRDPD